MGQGTPSFLLAGWAKLECPVQRLCPPGSFDWEKEEIFPFLQQCRSSRAIPDALLLTGRLRWMSPAHGHINSQGDPQRDPPQRSTAHIPSMDHLIYRKSDELTKHMSAIWHVPHLYHSVVHVQLIQWPQLGQTHMPMLYSTQTLISPWHFPGRALGTLQLKTHSEYKIV